MTTQQQTPTRQGGGTVPLQTPKDASVPQPVEQPIFRDWAAI